MHERLKHKSEGLKAGRVNAPTGTTSEPDLSEPTGKTGGSPAIQWKRGEDDWMILSKCGRFKIRKRCTEPATSKLEAEFTYEAFHIATGQWDFSLGLYRDPKAARERCEDHEREMTALRRSG